MVMDENDVNVGMIAAIRTSKKSDGTLFLGVAGVLVLTVALLAGAFFVRQMTVRTEIRAVGNGGEK